MTAKQQAWLTAYQSGQSATEAVITAGYMCDNRHNAQVIGNKLLKQFGALLLTDGKRAADEDARQAGIDEIRRFWASVIRDEHADTRDRLKASELAARSIGAFVERREVVQTQPFEVRVTVED